MKVLVTLLCLGLVVCAVQAGATPTTDGGQIYHPADLWNPTTHTMSGFTSPDAAYNPTNGTAAVITDGTATTGQAFEARDYAVGATNQSGTYWYQASQVGSYGASGSETVTAEIRAKITPTQTWNFNDTSNIGATQNIMTLIGVSGRAVRLDVFTTPTYSYTFNGGTSVDTHQGQSYLVLASSGGGSVYGTPEPTGFNVGMGGANVVVTESDGFVYDGTKGFHDFQNRIGASYIPIDMSVYHTYTVATYAVSGTTGFYTTVLVDGVSVFDADAFGNPNYYLVNSAKQGAAPSGAAIEFGLTGNAAINCAGSVAIDWVAYKAGNDPYWVPTAIVPEPGSLLALSAGLIGLVGFIRRKKA